MMLLLTATTAFFAYRYYFLEAATADVVARIAKNEGVEACWGEIESSGKGEGQVTSAKWKDGAELTGFRRGRAESDLYIFQVGDYYWSRDFKNLQATLNLTLEDLDWLACDFDLATGSASVYTSNDDYLELPDAQDYPDYSFPLGHYPPLIEVRSARNGRSRSRSPLREAYQSVRRADTALIG